MNVADLSPSERIEARRLATEELVRAGDLRHLLHADQREVQAQMRRTPQQQFVLEIARRYGKTWLMVAEALSTCLRFPGSRVPYGSSTDKSLREFVQPAISELVADFPPDCTPTFNSFDGHWTFPNGSHIHLFGCEDDLKARRSRGPPARRVFLDEGGFIPIMGNVVENVLRPMLMHLPIEDTPCSIVIGSSPAAEPDHPFTVAAEIAEANGAYATRTIYDNPLLTAKQVENFIAKAAEANGMGVEEYRQTDTFQREYMARRVGDKLLTVLPEWSAKRDVRALERPAFFDAHAILDPGGADPHAVLFGYWHFPEAKWVLEDELLLRNSENSTELADAIKAKERELYGTDRWDGTVRAFEESDAVLLDAVPEWMRDAWKKSAPQNPRVRFMDTNIVMCRDLYDLHGLAFIPTAKDDLQAQVNNLRVLVNSSSVVMHPRCVHTDRHWRTTTWANHRRREFARRAGEHGDLLACGIYGARNLDRQRNPFPSNWGASQDMRDRRPKQATLAEKWGRALKG